jgi:hypothetical protein
MATKQRHLFLTKGQHGPQISEDWRAMQASPVERRTSAPQVAVSSL